MAYVRPAEHMPYGINPEGMTRFEYKEALREHHERLQQERLEIAGKVIKFVFNLGCCAFTIWALITIGRTLVQEAREECLRDVVACRIIASQNAK